MKKFRSAALAVLFCAVFTVSACSFSAPGEMKKSGKKNPNPQGSVSSVSSSIFKRNVEYDSFVPHESVSLPVNGQNILDALQIDKNIYILADDGVYNLNIIDGSGGKMIDLPYAANDTEKKSSLFISSYGENIFVYSSEIGEISEYSGDGSLIGKLNNDELCCESVNAFAVTDNNLVIARKKANANGNPEHQLAVFDKKNAQLISIYKAKKEITDLYSYKENKLLYTSENLFSTDTAYDICVFDADNGKAQISRTLSGIGDRCLIDLVYNPQTDTVLTFSDTFLGFKELGRPYVAEFSLSDDDNIIWKRLSFDPGNACFIGVSENIVSVISAKDGRFEYFDFLNPPRSITLAYNDTSKGYLTEIILEFESEYGIMVRTTDYRDNLDIIDLKLMAGDADFDLFCPVGYSTYKYIKTNMYGDLSKYPSLISKLEESRAATVAAMQDNVYFGVPKSLEYIYPRDECPEGSKFAFSRLATLCQYCAENIDIAEMTYSDSNGDEFYKVLRFAYDYPLGSEKNMPYGNKFIDYKFRGLGSDYIMLNPASKNKDDAALFMEYVLDAYSGNIPSLSKDFSSYMELDDGEYFMNWNLIPMSIVQPLYTAFNAVSQTDGSKSELKKLAKKPHQRSPCE